MAASFITEWMEYRFDERGRLESLKDRKTGKDIAVPGSPAFYLADTYDGIIGRNSCPQEKIILPEKVTVKGNEIICRFEKADVTFFLEANPQPMYVAFTVKAVHPAGAKFGQFVFAGGVAQDDDLSFCASSASMSQTVATLEIPGRSRRLGVTLFDYFAAKPATAAILAMPFAQLGDGIKAVFEDTDDILKNKKGGPYGAETPDAHYDYLLQCHRIDPYDETTFDRFEAFGVKQVDFHQGAEYRQADFVFDPKKYPEGAKSFKELVSDKLHARGMQAGLHTYTSMIDFRSRYVTPVPSHDLENIRVYTLAKDISEEDTELYIEEATDDIPLVQRCYAHRHMTTLRVGDELIDFTGKGDHVLTGCVRGTLDTGKFAHKKGEKLYHLENRFDYFISKPGSELFFEVARNTAQAYNEGGFDTYYFDGCECSDGAHHRHIHWYYESLFVREVLKYTERTPIVEYSTINGPLWGARSRAGAFDSFTSGYCYGIEVHCQSNEEDSHKRLLPSQLGWYDLYPPASRREQYANWYAKIPFEEDTDYLGIKSIAYASGMSYLSKGDGTEKEFPAYQKAVERIALYSKLRDGTQFSADVIAKLKEKGSMFRITEDRKGIERIDRLYARPHSLAEGENEVSVVNSFEEQKPVVRLIAQHAADVSAGGKTVLSFDREKPIEDKEFTFDSLLDISGREALGIWVKGCGRDAYVTILLKGAPPHGVGYGEHVISLNYTGWRFIMLCDNDNGDYTQLDYPSAPRGRNFSWHHYHREALSYAAIGAISVLTMGDVTGAAMGDLEAYPVSSAPIRDLTVALGGESVTFRGELNPGEYLEYKPGEAAALVFDTHGEKGSMAAEGAVGVLPAGESKVVVSGEAQGSNRIKMNLIITGERIC